MEKEAELAASELDSLLLSDDDEKQQPTATPESNSSDGATKSGEPESFTFKSGDDEYSREQLEDAIDAFKNKSEWTTSNTNKAKEVKDQRRLIEPILQEFAPKLKSNPEFAEAFDDLWKDMTGSDKGIVEMLTHEGLDGIPNPFSEDLETSRTEIETLTGELSKLKSDIALEKEVTALTSKYPLTERQVNAVAEDLLKRFEDTGTWMSLEDVLRLDHPDWANPSQAISTNNGASPSTAPVTMETPKSYKAVPLESYADLVQ